MITIKNKLRQPLVINVAEEGAIHFLAKETKTNISEVQFNSPEMKNHIEKGNLIVLRME